MDDFNKPKKMQKINAKIISIIVFIIIIVFAFIFFKNENVIYKAKNNPVSLNNSYNNNKPAATAAPVITASPSPVATSAPKLSGCNEIDIGNKTRKEIALTFDAGSGTGSVDKILEILKENNIRSTFFLTGKWAEQNPEFVKKISNGGHEIYNHTYSHPDLTKSTPEEIKSQLERTEEIIKKLTGKSTKPFFRPPYGARDKTTLKLICEDYGYQAIMWTVDALDWKEGTTAETAISRVFSKEKNGEIILMHVGDNLSAEILPDIIKRFMDDGYRIVTISEIVRN